ncbi:Far8p NDAI_0B01420 [Naumovozyma dairenensis CBS 421]|uniref:Striatin N-terminal domain-containing protein n=1 Tax=Naumovozyma dairenensis (strain ATCC 10597 / BCRC 20456 / CBS 421 / NBRC 0211 / NRRL Y-12639) TaxID=1071378 RepID=G0W5W5_NAUDC|nr:hypothetical protein NDAI_0B01420 [Naumovozyma dairenensis CBS 421]CCD23176.1 hypothetical protein NDAI_0B01420 [Naumovozyma dairenensis CBS 421]
MLPNQSFLQTTSAPHYTLPGVMHYLQTEFTKNERDRITWELERSEMKAKISQLEGENRDLRYKLAKLELKKESKKSNCESDLQETGKEQDEASLSSLIKSRTVIQENVKEIVYLLKNADVSNQLNLLNAKNDNMVHNMENLNLNLNSQPNVTIDPNHNIIEPNNDNANMLNTSQMFNLGHDQNSSNLQQNTAPMEDIGNIDEGGEQSETETIVLDDDSHPVSSSSSSLFKEPNFNKKMINNTVESFTRNDEDDINSTTERSDCDDINSKRIIWSSSPIKNLNVLKNNILTSSNDNSLKYGKIINENLDCKSMNVINENGKENYIKIFLIDSSIFLTITNVGVQLHNINEQKILSSLNIFEQESIDNIESIDFKNNRLLIGTNNRVYIWELKISTKEYNLEIINSYVIQIDTSKSILSAILGMTEKSLIILTSSPYEMIIYSFQGKLLQSIKLSENGSLTRRSESSASNTTNGKLYLNKETSKIIIQLNKHLSTYSFDHKKVIMQEHLEFEPIDMIFQNSKDIICFAFANGSIEVRKLNTFQNIIKQYNHYDETIGETGDTDGLVIQLLWQGQNKSHNQDQNQIPVIVSGGEDGILRLERIDDYI